MPEAWARRIVAGCCWLALGALALASSAGGAAAGGAPAGGARPSAPHKPRWQTLPAPAALPEPTQSGTVTTDDVRLWYAIFGEGEPVLLLHGGLGNANHFGGLVAALAERHQVIVLDSRGHGRSTRSRHGISYLQMAKDVIALLDHLALPRVAIVGWSDGGVTGLQVAIRHPRRVTKLYLLGTNYALAGAKPSRSKTFVEYFARCKREYEALAPDARQLGPLLKELRAMWSTQPTIAVKDLVKIRARTVVALGEHDENIRRQHAVEMAELIPDATLQILPDTSHFALWQDPEGFARSVLGLLDERPGAR
jgi:pimeloyl-ACP methyl ester carboxylesterase